MKFYLEHRFPELKVDILDPDLEPIEFTPGKYRLIGFSTTHETLEFDLALAVQARRNNPGIPILFGGVEATFNHDLILASGPADAVVLGEGEEPMEDILQEIQQNPARPDLARVAGLVVKRGPNDCVRTQRRRALDKYKFVEVSRLFDFSRVNYRAYWDYNAAGYAAPNLTEINTIRIFTGNFCPWDCEFCASTNYLDYAYEGDFEPHKKTKVVTIDDAVTLNLIIEACRMHADTKSIIFDDDNFIMGLKRVQSLCQKIVDLKARGEIPQDLTFLCQARINSFKVDPEERRATLALMKRAGFRMIMFGVESFSKRVLNEFNKRTEVDMIHTVLDATLRAGIVPLVYVILFSPAAEMDDILTTIRNAARCVERGMTVSTTYWILDLPGTNYAKNRTLERQYRRVPVGDGYELTISDYLFPTDSEVLALGREAERRYKEYEAMLCERYGIGHVPGKIFSLICFYAITDILGMAEERQIVIDALETLYPAETRLAVSWRRPVRLMDR